MIGKDPKTLALSNIDQVNTDDENLTDLEKKFIMNTNRKLHIIVPDKDEEIILFKIKITIQKLLLN